MSKFRHELHYITPLENLKSILEKGILSHELANDVEHISIALEEVQNRREHKSFKDGLKLHQYANLYIDARNPMMYKRKDQYKDICVLYISLDILSTEGIIISNMNAACADAQFFRLESALVSLDFDKFYAESWFSQDPQERDHLKAVRCAEVLIPHKIIPEYFIKIIVATEEVKAKINQFDAIIPIEINDDLYFNPEGYDIEKVLEMLK